MTDRLQRRIGPGLLTAYGVGVMVGAGIYVIVGAVAGSAGVWLPLACLLAGLLATPTALSFAEFSTRLPKAVREAAYVGEGLHVPWLAVRVGLAVVVGGTISGAAVLRGGVAYLTEVIDLLVWIGVLVLGLILTGIAIAGVWESPALMACLTVIELGGLVLDMWAGFSAPMVAEFANPPPIPWIGLAFGAVLAFFAFIGFEDIVNMAEEVNRPQRSLSLAIMAALAITIVIYAAISWATLRSVPASDLAASEAPLVLVWQAGTGQSPQFLSLIAVAAALNGILALIVMVARVLFGLGKRSPALAPLRRVNLRFGTPVTATLFVGAFLTLAALILPVVTLASSTAVILLTVFALVNLSLLRIKRRGVPHSGFTVPIWVPCLGLVLAMVALMASLLGILGWS